MFTTYMSTTNPTTTKTPGYNCRLTIWFSTTKTGKRRAYYMGRQSLRAFPIGVAAAELAIATETADQVHCNPMKGCDVCKAATR